MTELTGEKITGVIWVNDDGFPLVTSDYSCPYWEAGADGAFLMHQCRYCRFLDFRQSSRMMLVRSVCRNPRCRVAQFRRKQRMIIDIAGKRATIDETDVPLTTRELDILLLLAKEPGKIFDAAEIYRKVWEAPDSEVVATVRVHIGRLRRKLAVACPDRQFVETVWRKGYLLRQSSNDGPEPIWK